MGWPRSPKFLAFLMPPLLSLNAIPFFLLGLILIYLFAFRFPWFPTTGGFYAGTFPAWTFDFGINVFKHSVLPALSIILVSIGGWALTMRSMIVTTTGEDFVTFADAKGLKNRTIFMRYAIRNALLPQATALALVLGQMIAGTVLVEVVFSVPRHRHHALQCHSGLRLHPHPGDRLLPDSLDRACDADSRPASTRCSIRVLPTQRLDP